MVFKFIYWNRCSLQTSWSWNFRFLPGVPFFFGGSAAEEDFFDLGMGGTNWAATSPAKADWENWRWPIAAAELVGTSSRGPWGSKETFGGVDWDGYRGGILGRGDDVFRGLWVLISVLLVVSHWRSLLAATVGKSWCWLSWATGIAPTTCDPVSTCPSLPNVSDAIL